MKKIVALVIIAAFVALFSIAAQASITTTKHNLSAGGPGTVKASAGQQNNEICIWCHTPHSANTGFSGAPLWNKATPAATYTMYGTTIANTTTASQPAASSLACLSCHDGSSAINSIVMDSSGNVVAGGTNVAFGATAAGTPVTMTGNANLGTDLSNDHPISITYTAGKASLVATSTAFGTSGTIASLLRGAGKDQVECGSCHDPHVASGDTTAQGTTAGTYFLRESNAGSALCLACHAK